MFGVFEGQGYLEEALAPHPGEKDLPHTWSMSRGSCLWSHFALHSLVRFASVCLVLARALRIWDRMGLRALILSPIRGSDSLQRLLG
jgi:hypothetical protein